MGLSKDVEPAVFRAEIFESRLDRKGIDQSVSRGPHLVGELGSKTGPLGASNKLGLSAELNSYSRDGLDSHGGRKQHPADSLNNERSLIGGKAEEKAPSRVVAQELPPLDRGVEKTEPRLTTEAQFFQPPDLEAVILERQLSTEPFPRLYPRSRTSPC